MKCVIRTDTRPELPHLAKYDSYPQGETDLRLYFADLWGLRTSPPNLPIKEIYQEHLIAGEIFPV